jgi:hypothetical protein
MEMGWPIISGRTELMDRCVNGGMAVPTQGAFGDGISMGNIIGAWYKTISAVNSEIFSGSLESLPRLTDMIVRGKMLVPETLAITSFRIPSCEQLLRTLYHKPGG